MFSDVEDMICYEARGASRASHGTAPTPIMQLFRPGVATLTAHGFRPSRPFHDRPIQDPVEPGHPVIIKRSVFGLIKVFHRLPADIVEAKNVKQFQ